MKEEKGEALLEKIKKIVKKEEILQLKITELDIKIMLVVGLPSFAAKIKQQK